MSDKTPDATERVAAELIREVLDAAARAEGFASFADTDWEIREYDALLSKFTQAARNMGWTK